MRQSFKIAITVLTVSTSGIVASGDARAQSQVTKDTKTGTWSSFMELRRKFRLGEINDSDLWQQLMKINSQTKNLPADQQAAISQTEASVLRSGGFPILASISAAQAIKLASQPLDDELKRSWAILNEVSREHPIQNLLESVASKVNLAGNLPPSFGTNWKYIEGNSLAKDKNAEKAFAAYGAVKVTDRYFFPAKYQQAMLHLDAGRATEAVGALKAIINPTSRELTSLNKDELRLITADANMALGRIYYEQRQFARAMEHYRMIDRQSGLFYDALFEQSWALFMAGRPNHALGTLYAVRSPFFQETFNPEATMLASVIYYWMCRYDDSRNELADFIEFHQVGIKALDEFLARKNLTDENAYTLFENTITGVSSEGLGLPRSLLNSAAQRDSLMYVRDQYASVLSELQTLELKGVYGNKDDIATPRNYLQQWANVLKGDIGSRFLVELQDMKKDYDRLHEQAQFLYVELLMSQKDQLLGKELHAQSKIGSVKKRDNIAGWGKQTQAWAADDKMEYWHDELGFHVYKLQPLCKAH